MESDKAPAAAMSDEMSDRRRAHRAEAEVPVIYTSGASEMRGDCEQMIHELFVTHIVPEKNAPKVPLKSALKKPGQSQMADGPRNRKADSSAGVAESSKGKANAQFPPRAGPRKADSYMPRTQTEVRVASSEDPAEPETPRRSVRPRKAPLPPDAEVASPERKDSRKRKGPSSGQRPSKRPRSK